MSPARIDKIMIHFLQTCSGRSKKRRLLKSICVRSGIRAARLLMFLLVLTACACALMAALQEPSRRGNLHGQSIQGACMRCHASGRFVPIREDADYDHANTGFPLEGMHAGIACRGCHIDLDFSKIGSECADCHADIHRRQMGADCEECHSIRGWEHVRTGDTLHSNRFPLMGAHKAVGCESCHTGAAVGLFRGLRTDCDFCHHADYVNAVSVEHVSAGFPLECETCHSTDGWLALFDHGGFTGFVLDGAHVPLGCEECHENFVFQGAPTDCVGCHLEDYNATTLPHHPTVGFSEDCALCHSTSSWLGAEYDHSATQFPLTGAHVGLACLDCHSSGQYAGLPSDCYSCHSEDFNATVDPAHVAAGYSQDCTECHTTSTWIGATVTHDGFPIYTGKHAPLWTVCSDCHTNSSNYSVFTCTTSACHPKVQADNQHREVSGYVFTSTACYDCHPRGVKDD